MPTIIPIIASHSRNSAPMTEGDEKTLLGMLIILTVIWILSSLFSIVKYLQIKNEYPHYDFLPHYFADYNLVMGFFHVMMSVIYVVLLLVLSGSFIGSFL